MMMEINYCYNFGNIWNKVFTKDFMDQIFTKMSVFFEIYFGSYFYWIMAFFITDFQNWLFWCLFAFFLQIYFYLKKFKNFEAYLVIDF